MTVYVMKGYEATLKDDKVVRVYDEKDTDNPISAFELDKSKHYYAVWVMQPDHIIACSGAFIYSYFRDARGELQSCCRECSISLTDRTQMDLYVVAGPEAIVIDAKTLRYMYHFDTNILREHHGHLEDGVEFVRYEGNQYMKLPQYRLLEYAEGCSYATHRFDNGDVIVLWYDVDDEDVFYYNRDKETYSRVYEDDYFVSKNGSDVLISVPVGPGPCTFTVHENGTVDVE